MAFVGSFNSRLYVGSLAFSAYTRGFTLDAPRDMLDVTTIVDTAPQFIPGQTSGTVSLDLLLDTDTTAGGEWAMLLTWEATPQVVSLCPSGTARGAETWNVLGNDAMLTVDSALTAPISASMSITCDGNVDAGVVIDPPTTISANTNGTALDNGALTSNGGVAHLHLTAYSGLTNTSVVVEHSVDNAAWATLGTFTTATGITSERLVIAAGTTVNRYLRVRDAITGVGSYSRFVTFARR
jgi:hypothetical protein